ncbi:MAG: trigger factor [Ruminococcaceae bacterium]|nr:trigger factor [Oscillospiraceae bacterium]
MLKSAEKTGTNEFTLALSISAEDFEKAVNKAYNKEKGNIAIPGFRKGKAPRAIIEKRYGEGVFYDDALDIAFPEAYEKAVEEAGITPVDNPFDFDIKEIGKNGVELICKVTVKPEVKIENYKGLSAVKSPTEVTDEEVEADLQKKLEQNARIIPVEGRAVQNGDIAVIDFEGFADGEAFEGGKAEEYELEIGSGSFIPGFEDQIIGHSVDEEFDVNVNFPEDYAETLAGKAATFKIKLHAIKAKELPVADDEFVKDVSEFDTLDEYKADIRKTLEDQKKTASDRNFENEIFDKLANILDAEIPEVMINRTVDNMISEFRYNVESQGIPFEQYLGYLGMSVDSIKETYRERAEKEVKIELALEKIAELENIEITDEDVEAEYKTMSEKYGVDIDTVKKAVMADTVKKELKARKASAIVTDNAVEEGAPKKKAAAKKPAAKKTTKKKAEEAPAEEKTEAAE